MTTMVVVVERRAAADDGTTALMRREAGRGITTPYGAATADSNNISAVSGMDARSSNSPNPNAVPAPAMPGRTRAVSSTGVVSSLTLSWSSSSVSTNPRSILLSTPTLASTMTMVISFWTRALTTLAW